LGHQQRPVVTVRPRNSSALKSSKSFEFQVLEPNLRLGTWDLKLSAPSARRIFYAIPQQLAVTRLASQVFSY
jgi:hypothetical protein